MLILFAGFGIISSAIFMLFHKDEFRNYYVSSFLVRSPVIENEVLNDLLDGIEDEHLTGLLPVHLQVNFKRLDSKVEKNVQEGTRLKLSVQVFDKHVIPFIVDSIREYLVRIPSIAGKDLLRKEQLAGKIAFLNTEIEKCNAEKNNQLVTNCLSLIDSKGQAETEMAMPVIEMIPISNQPLLVKEFRKIVWCVFTFLMIALSGGMVVIYLRESLKKQLP